MNFIGSPLPSYQPRQLLERRDALLKVVGALLVELGGELGGGRVHGIVLAALLRVREHLVGGLEILETLLDLLLLLLARLRDAALVRVQEQHVDDLVVLLHRVHGRQVALAAARMMS